jgi:UDP-N-acetylmuramoyl-L-alanyl-D-glutamate--2,6-diaminopimelate ligase
MARWFVDRSAHRGIPSVSLRRLLPGAAFAGVADLEVSGLSADSRRIEPGEAFVALRGARHDGHHFVARAFERGAAAAVVERPCPEAGRLQVVVPDARAAFARLAHALAGEPSGSLAVVGLAGEGLADAAAWYLRAILEAEGRRVGWVSAHGWSDGVASYPPRPEEPDAAELAAMLARMVERRCDFALVGLTSTSLDRRDTEGLRLAAAVVTDAGEGTDEARRRAWSRMARGVAEGGHVVLPARGPAAVLAGTNLGVEVVTFSDSDDHPSDLPGRVEALGPDGARLALGPAGEAVSVRLLTPGRRAALAALAASAASAAMGVPRRRAARALESAAAPPGHLRPWAGSRPDADGPRIYHQRPGTAGGLAGAVEALRDSGFGRIHVLVSVARAERAESLAALARVAEDSGGPVVVAREDGPAAPPEVRIDGFLAGFRRPGRVRVAAGVGQAIRSTLALAEPTDAVLLVGPAWPEPSSEAPEPDRCRPSPARLAPARRSA